jgi:hypothetical protein
VKPTDIDENVRYLLRLSELCRSAYRQNDVVAVADLSLQLQKAAARVNERAKALIVAQAKEARYGVKAVEVPRIAT